VVIATSAARRGIAGAASFVWGGREDVDGAGDDDDDLDARADAARWTPLDTARAADMTAAGRCRGTTTTPSDSVRCAEFTRARASLVSRANE
jgi:hypothetical protein